MPTQYIGCMQKEHDMDWDPIEVIDRSSGWKEKKNVCLIQHGKYLYCDMYVSMYGETSQDSHTACVAV